MAWPDFERLRVRGAVKPLGGGLNMVDNRRRFQLLSRCLGRQPIRENQSGSSQEQAEGDEDRRSFKERRRESREERKERRDEERGKGRGRGGDRDDD